MSPHRILLVFAAFLAGVSPSIARAQCATWDPSFRTDGFEDTVYSSAVYDDGTGPAIYAVGVFDEASGAPAHLIARFDGTKWRPLPHAPGEPISVLYAIHVWDDGTGPALYVGGYPWDTGSGLTSISKWNGSTWTALPGSPDDGVWVLQDFAGSLYAGGWFTQVDGHFQPGIARWTGSVWGGVSGMLGLAYTYGVYSLTVFDDGSGPALYAGGSFDSAGGVSSPNLARWDGSAWSVVAPTGLSYVSASAVFDFGGGAELVAAGPMSGGSRVMRLHLGSWSTVGGLLVGGTAGSVSAFAVHDDGAGGGEQLYVAGSFSYAGGVQAFNVARWNGSAWTALASILGGAVKSLLVHDVQSVPRLFAFGNIATADNQIARHAAQWDGAHWSPLEQNNAIVGQGLFAFAHYDDGHGDALYLGGSFSIAGPLATRSVVRWDGTTWSHLGNTVLDGGVLALCVFDDGSGEKLYAGGGFYSAGFGSAQGIGRWDGTQWAPLPGGFPFIIDPYNGVGVYVRALVVHDDGSGPALYAGGRMQMSTTTSYGIVRWQNGTWSALGQGLQGEVDALVVHDDGTGPALYAGGAFGLPGSQVLECIAKWDGSTWSSVGGSIPAVGTGARVWALASFDDGNGPALFAGGYFSSAGGVPVSNVARYGNGSWSALGYGTAGGVGALLVHDDGSGHGPALYVAGGFASAGGIAASSVARWDGTSWSPLAAGVSNANGSPAYVNALAVWNHGASRDLYLGGTFDSAGGEPSGRFARFIGCGETGRTVCFGDGSGTACPCGNASAPGDRAGCLHSFGSGGTLRAAGEPSLSDDSLVLHGASMTDSTVLYFQGAGLVAGGAGAGFGDGLRCASGPFVRLATKSNSAGASIYPASGELPLSVRGAVFQPGTRTYQARYRNSASFCTGDTFNTTNAVEILWMH